MTTNTEHLYVARDDSILGGEPIIKGTRTPVRAIVETWRMGIAPEDITSHLPHLTLAQVFDALSYFADHRDEIAGYIEQNNQSGTAGSRPVMQQIQVPSQVYESLQRRASEAGYATISEYVSDLTRRLSEQQDAEASRLFTPERLAHLDDISSSLRNGGKSYTLDEVDKHFERKRKTWAQKDAS